MKNLKIIALPFSIIFLFVARLFAQNDPFKEIEALMQRLDPKNNDAKEAIENLQKNK